MKALGWLTAGAFLYWVYVPPHWYILGLGFVGTAVLGMALAASTPERRPRDDA